MRKLALLTTLVFSLAHSASAENGAYFGLGASANFNSAVSSEVSFFQATSTDFAFALTAGYRWSLPNTAFWGVEANVDFGTGELMSDDGIDACTDISPDWCNIDSVARLRATYGRDLANGTTLMGSFGLAAAQGRLEVNPGDYRDATGTGISVGVAWEKPLGGHAVRVDLNYDFIDDDNHPTYPRELEILSIRASYMF